MVTKKIAPTKALGITLVHAALSVLKENGGELPLRELFDAVEKRVDLDDWAKEQYKKSGYVRWRSVLHFYSIDCVKAGFLVKKSGVWYITPEGQKSLSLGPVALMAAAQKGYDDWKAEKAQPLPTEKTVEDETDDDGISLEQAEAMARDGFAIRIQKLNAYEFQDLVAALLRGMGYYTPFVAPQGKDGGIDIMAYRDPLGTQSPRIQVQIKHRQCSTSVQEIRQLMGLLQKEGDVGLFVSTGGFTPDAKTTARSSHVHVELVDLPRFVSLWQEYYAKLPDADKALLPMTPVYFVAED